MAGKILYICWIGHISVNCPHSLSPETRNQCVNWPRPAEMKCLFVSLCAIAFAVGVCECVCVCNTDSWRDKKPLVDPCYSCASLTQGSPTPGRVDQCRSVSHLVLGCSGTVKICPWIWLIYYIKKKQQQSSHILLSLSYIYFFYPLLPMPFPLLGTEAQINLNSSNILCCYCCHYVGLKHNEIECIMSDLQSLESRAQNDWLWLF